MELKNHIKRSILKISFIDTLNPSLKAMKYNIMPNDEP